jgi:ligand-binding SRPBCC domain-containing protein
VSASHAFTISTPLRAPAERVWAHASTFAGVNRELWPLVRMTFPPALGRLTPETFPVGRTAFRSWILLFGLVPVEFDDIALVELAPGRGFSEVSRMFSVREWRHRRTVTPAADGCVVRDEIAFVPRWRWAGGFLAWVYRRVFELWHRALRRLFGAARSVGHGRTDPPT